MENDMKNMSKTQYAYEYIRSQITDGIYGPGHRIVIDQMAKELKLSTIPVREAIRQLEADGFIQYKPYSGAIVSMIDETEYLETLSVLAVLDGYATALGAKRLTKESLASLEECNREMDEALYNFEFEEFGKLNRKFHSVIHDHCGNSYLIEEMRQASQRLDRVRRTVFTFVPQRARESIKEHTRIIEMIREQAPFAEIEEYARQHKLNTIIAFQNRKKGM